MKLSAIKEKLKPDIPMSFKITKNITLNTSKYRLITAGTLSVLLLTIVLIGTSSFFNSGVSNSTGRYILCIIGALVTGMIAGFKYSVPAKAEKRLTRLLIISIPIGTMAMSECLIGVNISSWLIMVWIYNCIFYALLYLAVYALTGSRRTPFLVINTIIYLLALTNHYVLMFRGTPFQPIDLLYTSTAATVAGNYEFTLDYQVVISTVMFVLMTALAWKIKTNPQKLWKKIYYRVYAGILAVAILGGYFVTDAMTKIGLEPQFFNQTRGYQIMGTPLSFFMNIKYQDISEPDGYNANEIEDIVYSVLDENTTETDRTDLNDVESQPNIIIIMNETLSDLSVLGEVKTNKDYMPFLRALTENTVKGNLYVPVLGGTTSNTEFEFLTGISTAFLPAGSNPYALYINRSLNSLPANLTTQGYTTTAFHPYYKDNWNRINVYDHLGFENYLGIEDILDEAVVDLMKSGTDMSTLTQKIEELYPGEDILTRFYVNDSYDYKKVIEMYENKDEGTPLFLFNVTMQNHGGYADTYKNFNEEIYLVDDNGEPIRDYPETNQYLSLIYETDNATKDLVSYFSNQEEPTIICIFGDHQPKIENEFIARTFGTESIYNLTLEQTQSRYCTPFYIWANYDIEEKEIDKLSVNYLSSYLMNIIGRETPVLNQYLLRLSETLPVIDTIGYIDADNNYYTYDQETQYRKLITGYEKICYNYLFDNENYSAWLYNKAP